MTTENINDLIEQQNKLKEKILDLKSKNQDIGSILAVLRNYTWDVWAGSLKPVNYSYTDIQKIFAKYFVGIRRKGFIELEEYIRLDKNGCINLDYMYCAESQSTEKGMREQHLKRLKKLLEFATKHDIKLSVKTHKDQLQYSLKHVKELEEEIKLIQGTK